MSSEEQIILWKKVLDNLEKLYLTPPDEFAREDIEKAKTLHAAMTVNFLGYKDAETLLEKLPLNSVAKGTLDLYALGLGGMYLDALNLLRKAHHPLFRSKEICEAVKLLMPILQDIQVHPDNYIVFTENIA